MREKRANADLKELQVAEIKGQLVNIDELKPLLESALQHFRSELMGAGNRLKTKVDALYGINLDEEIINELFKNALKQFAEYPKSL
jgi:hypothetical protein